MNEVSPPLFGAHYHKIVVALSETIRLMPETDPAIEEHVGWPHT